MDNFLDHLVARSWNRAEVIQPRPVSLFEPSSKRDNTAVPPTFAWSVREETPFNDTPTGDEMLSTGQPPPRPPLKRHQSVQLLEGEPVTEPMKETAVPAKMPQPFDLPLGTAVPIPAAQPVEPEITMTQSHHLPTDMFLEPEKPAVARLPLPAANPLPVGEMPVRPQPNPLLPQEPVGQPPQMALPVANSPQQSAVTWLPATKQPENRATTRQEIVQERVIERSVMANESHSTVVEITSLLSPVQPLPPIYQVVPFQEPSPPTAALPTHPHEAENGPKPEPALAEKFITTVRPQIRPFIPPQTARPPEPQPEASPTINVTIGRIEVRATPTPTVTDRKERPQSPVMGLEEYLRRRNGGQP